MLRRHRVRAAGITSMVAKRGDVTLPTRLGTSLDSLEYVVTVGLGTPAVTQTLLIDSGSDISWVQCPVPPCHPQNDAVFDPARSATYAAFSCGSAGCRGLSRALSNGCTASSLCQYTVEYGDGSNSTGTYSADKLTLTPAHAVDGFRFGCSHVDPLITDRTASLLGLGGGAVSLVGQTAEKAFSYCLRPTEAHSRFLTLGAPPRASASRFVVTPMHRVVSSKTFYGVRLQGIAVARRRLDVPRSVFAAGSVLDSGTVITQLPPTARAAFREEMRMHGYRWVVDPTVMRRR